MLNEGLKQVHGGWVGWGDKTQNVDHIVPMLLREVEVTLLHRPGNFPVFSILIFPELF